MDWLRMFWRSLLIGLVPGVLAGVAVMAIAWRHNPQGEFHAAGVVHWGPWLAVGLSWLAIVRGVVTLLAAVLLLTVSGRR